MRQRDLTTILSIQVTEPDEEGEYSVYVVDGKDLTWDNTTFNQFQVGADARELQFVIQQVGELYQEWQENRGEGG